MDFKPYLFSEETLLSRVDEALSRQSRLCDRNESLKTIFQCIDFTTLEAFDNETKINDFCSKALSFKDNDLHISVPAVCIYSPFVRQAKELLRGSGIKVATVACAFPSGQMPFELKRREVEYCVEQGADEVDMVISRGTFLAGRLDEVYEEIKSVREACAPPVRLKVILETGELKSVENIRRASEIAINAGADFIKTSTGKSPVSATPLAAIIMCDTIKEYFEATGRMVGFKPAGGMSTIDDALTYFYIVREVLGERWLNKDYFRVGTSRLAGKVMDELMQNK
ncbi:MAG: deoxyribose-phosphate aldolase [Bacteroidales bacterium]|nr:deoxyribose-phosphate aldolase [Bacteroidales bacterium]MDD5979270.1 deoxyribose-phosphate aldolase [Bacteroidales bacterium]